MSGLAFVSGAANVAAVVGTVFSVLLVALEFGPDRHGFVVYRRLTAFWSCVARTPWPAVAALATGSVTAGLERAIHTLFVDADRSAFFNALFLGLVFLALPAMALLNALVGGSSLLVTFCAVVVVVFAMLNLSGEIGATWLFNRACATFLGISVFFFIPAYVLQSFSDRLLKEVVGHAVLESILVAPLGYILAYSAMIFFDNLLRGRARRLRDAINGFLAALPVSYVLTFAAVLVGHFAVADPEPKKTWALLLASMVFASAALPFVIAVLKPVLQSGRGLALAAAYGTCLVVASGFSILLYTFAYAAVDGAWSVAPALNVLVGMAPDGGHIYLGPAFWVAHLPYIPIALCLAGFAIGLLAKTVAALLGALRGEAFARDKPLLSSGLLCAMLSLLAWGLAGLT
ncbi:MAG: hypothetical protein QF902_08030 [Rhodospirillales bacterium]|jgi:hypothetical protein|nr:hypothetical protein [Rhodospirillales bacterium]